MSCEFSSVLEISITWMGWLVFAFVVIMTLLALIFLGRWIYETWRDR